MQSWRLNGIPWGFAEMANVGHFERKERAVGRRRENPITAYIAGTEGLDWASTHPPRWSVLTRERNPPSGSTNQIAASVAHAIASINLPFHYRLWCPLPSPLSILLPTKISNFPPPPFKESRDLWENWNYPNFSKESIQSFLMCEICSKIQKRRDNTKRFPIPKIR